VEVSPSIRVGRGDSLDLVILRFFVSGFFVRDDSEGSGLAEDSVTCQSFMIQKLVKEQLDIQPFPILDLNTVPTDLDLALYLRLEKPGCSSSFSGQHFQLHNYQGTH
jgi:hypothetical protein